MRCRNALRVLTLLSLLALFLAAQGLPAAEKAATSAPATKAGQLRAGVSRVDSTPPVFPVSLVGSFNDRKAQSAHDPLSVRSLVVNKLRETAHHCGHADIIREALDGQSTMAAISEGKDWAQE